MNASFHKDNGNYDVNDGKNCDYSTKKVQEEIIDFARSHDYLRARLLSDHTEEFNGVREYFIKQNTQNESSSTTSNNESNNSNSGSDHTVVQDKQTITPTTNTTTTSSRIDQRKFHTSAYKFNSKKLNNLSIAPQPLPATPEPLLVPKEAPIKTILNKKDSKIGEYLESIKKH